MCRPWIGVIVVPEKINVIQHGGDEERSRPHVPKYVHNFLLTVRAVNWACDLVAEMSLIPINLLAT